MNSISRRHFLQYAMSGIGLTFFVRSIPNWILDIHDTQRPPRIQFLDVAFDGGNLFELFGEYSSNIGAGVIDRIDLPSRGNDPEIQRTESELAKGGYTEYADTVYSQNSRGELYIVGHENRIDVCIPVFRDYKLNVRKPMYEAGAMIGLAVATNSYNAKYNPSTNTMAKIFMPTHVKPEGHNAEDGSLLNTTKAYPSSTLHPTENGKLDIDYYPPKDSDVASVSVKARGDIQFTKNYNFKIVPADN